MKNVDNGSESLNYLLGKVILGMSGRKDQYLSDITRSLCEAFNADVVLIGRISSDALRLTTVSVFLQNNHIRNFSVPLEDTPCARVIECDELAIGEGAALLFPRDSILQRLNAQAYVGIKLTDDEGKTIGLMALISSNPIEDVQSAVLLQQLFAIPAAMELSRSLRAQPYAVLEQRLESILAIAEDAIICVNEDHQIVMFNEGAKNIFGYSRNEIVGKSINLLLPVAMRENHAALMNEFLASDEDSRLMRQRARGLVGLRKDGSEFPVEASITRSEIDGRQTVTVVLRDVTERRRSEMALQYAHKMQTLGNVAAGLSHDFNNILTFIRGSVQLALLDDVDRRFSRKHLEMAVKEIDRGAGLVSRLMTFGRPKLQEPVLTNPAIQLEQLQDMLCLTIGEGIETRFECDEDTWSVIVDKSQLENAIVNLVLNARDAMNHTGLLGLKVANVTLDDPELTSEIDVLEGDYVCVSVSDSGIGMDDDTRRSALEPFYSTKEEAGGTGLGLSMVYGFARSSRGGLRLLSREGAGTTVELYLPRTQANTPSEDVWGLEASSVGTERILIVEDHPQVRELAVFYAKSLGYQVLEAEDGPQGMALLNEKSGIDLLFTDYQMPGGLCGLDLARRAIDLGIAVVLCSGYGVEELQGVACTVLPKPYSRHSLGAAIEGALDGRRASAVL